MTRPSVVAWIKRLALAAVLIGVGGTVAPKSADAQLYLNLPFVSVGVGYPYYYPSYYYGYPYYYRSRYWHHYRRCHWWHHRCHYY